MPLNLRALRYPMLALLLFVGGAVLVAWLTEQTSDAPGAPSSYSVRKYGAKAAYLLLLRSGYKVERWEREPQQLPAKPAGVTLVMAGPEQYPTAEQSTALKNFVRSGGRLLITGNAIEWADFASGVEYGTTRVGYEECAPAAPTALSRAGSITQEGDLEWVADIPGQVVHYRDKQGQAVVISYPLGQGEVIWWASALPLTNIGLRDKGNLEFLLYSIGPSQHILWDEYFHVKHDTARATNYARVLRWAKWQIALLGVFLLVAYARRLGPVVALPAPSRLSPLEFVETMGNVFHKADARIAPLEIALARLRQVAARRLATAPAASVEEIAAAMQLRGYPVNDGLREALRAAEDATLDPGIKINEAVKHAGTLHKVLAIMEREHT